jgi:hypothetical protein
MNHCARKAGFVMIENQHNAHENNLCNLLSNPRWVHSIFNGFVPSDRAEIGASEMFFLISSDFLLKGISFIREQLCRHYFQLRQVQQ